MLSRMEPLRIRLLGTFSVEFDGRVITTLASGRLQSLIALLALRRGTPQYRRQLATSFWPDATDARSQANLRTLVHRLRRALPEADRFLRVDGRFVQWRDDSAVIIDVASFEAATRAGAEVGALEEAIDLYAGDLLPGCYDAWIEPERERLRRAFARALDRLIEVLETGGRFDRALEYVRRRIEHDPLDEGSYRTAMRLHALAGDRAGALRVYRRCEAILADEVGTEPDQQTRDAYRRLQAMGDALPVTDAPGDSTRPPLVGREEEWSRLQRGWNRALGGGVQAVAVTGEPGIGKTRLVEDFARWVEKQGFPVARGRAYQLQAGLVFAPVVPWIRAGLARAGSPGLEPVWLAELARVVPELRGAHPSLSEPPPTGAGVQQERLYEAMARAVRLSNSPLVLVLDDVQWCDTEVFAWLQFLVYSDPRPAILLLLTWRSDEVRARHPARIVGLEMRKSGILTEIELGPLDARQSAQVAGALLDARTAPPPEWVCSAAQGNPLFIVELVRYNLARPTAPGVQEGDTARPLVPPTVRGVIESRLEQLGSEARSMIDAAAVIGRHFDVELATAVTGVSGGALMHALDELSARRLLDESSPGRLDMHHDLVREVTYSALGRHHRRDLHRRVAEALLARRSDPVSEPREIAVHYDRAGLPEPAARFYLQGARAAFGAGAASTAIAMLERALALCEAVAGEGGDALSREIREQLADLFHVAGRYAEARDLFARSSEATLPATTRARSIRKTAKTWIAERDLASALRALDEAKEVLADSPDRAPEWWHEWIQVSLDRTAVLYWTDGWPEIERIHREIAPLLEEHGSAEQRRHRRQSLLGMMVRRDRQFVSHEMITLARENLASCLGEGHVSTIAVSRFQLGYLLLLWDHGDEAEAELLAALRLAERTPDRSLRSRCLIYLAILYRVRGLHVRAQEHTELALQAATEMGDREYAGAARGNLAWLHWRRRHYQAAREHGLAALEDWNHHPPGAVAFPLQWVALWPIIAATLDSRDRGASAEEAMPYVQRLLDRSQARLEPRVEAALERAVEAWRNGRSAESERHLEQARDLSRESGYL